MGDTSPRLGLLQMFGALWPILPLHSHSYTVVRCLMAVGGRWILVTLKTSQADAEAAQSIWGPCSQKCFNLKVF